MEREILFRAKRKDDGEWIEGYYCRFGYTGEEKDYIIPSYASALYAIEVNPSTVGRFTGLTDKNGTRIFEGDVVRIVCHPNSNYGKLAVIEWDEEPAMFVIDGQDFVSTFCNYFGHDLEVIGNIHDGGVDIG